MLKSVIPQLHEGDELLLVDDCSTDGSQEVVRDLLDSKVSYHKTAVNSGPATARNQGVARSMGEFLLFFDADDIAHPQMLERVRAALVAFAGEHLFAFRIAYEMRGEQHTVTNVHATGAAPKCTVLATGAFVRAALERKTLCTASSTCVSRSAFESERGFIDGLRYCEDPELWVRLSARYRTVLLDEVLAIYRHVPASLSYGMRAIPGSVQPYVQTLLRLAETGGQPYRSLAKSVVRKNAVFSRAAHADRSTVTAYLRSVAFLFGSLERVALLLAVWVPGDAWRMLLACRPSLVLARIRGT